MNETEYELSKELWHECFPEDGSDFIERYYRERSKPEYALGAFPRGSRRPAAMLHMIPVKMSFGGKAKDICFVAGVCTAVRYRRRGICGKLFQKAFEIMRDRGFDATVLQPFDPRFYERFGYKTFITRQNAAISYEEPRSLGQSDEEPAIAPDSEKLLSLYRGFTRGFSGCTIRDEEYFKGFIEEFSADGARLVCTENGCCAGYEEGEGEFVAYELFFRDGADPVKLLPPGFCKYVFPLPIGAKAPEGSFTVIEGFSMIMPLAADFVMGDGPFYGFDRY
ncbi:MAG: GNAT family N-acetyltransferase [Clostridiales bacterium]|nr:GNAT family N-acetyltransferase [Clostridiales bacterium]